MLGPFDRFCEMHFQNKGTSPFRNAFMSGRSLSLGNMPCFALKKRYSLIIRVYFFEKGWLQRALFLYKPVKFNNFSDVRRM